MLRVFVSEDNEIAWATRTPSLTLTGPEWNRNDSAFVAFPPGAWSQGAVTGCVGESWRAHYSFAGELAVVRSDHRGAKRRVRSSVGFKWWLWTECHWNRRDTAWNSSFMSGTWGEMWFLRWQLLWACIPNSSFVKAGSPIQKNRAVVVRTQITVPKKVTT